jgi:aryl-alcohol dehydrogenase-like predicted oxidoreductase
VSNSICELARCTSTVSILSQDSANRTFASGMMQACADKNGWTKFVSMQNQYSLLYREEEREMNKYCDATGVGLIPVSDA